MPAAGDYSLKVDREGFYVFSEPLIAVPAIPPGEPPFELHIALQSIYEIRSTVEVKGNPGVADMDRVTPQTTLSSRTLYDVPFPNQNSLRSGLRMIPGVIQDSSGGIHMYGGAEDQAQYSFEGFQLNDPLTGQFDARMSLESVQSVDAQSSPSDADMGRGEAGTMLLHARTGTDEFKVSGTAVFPSIDIGTGPQDRELDSAQQPFGSVAQRACLVFQHRRITLVRRDHYAIAVRPELHHQLALQRSVAQSVQLE